MSATVFYYSPIVTRKKGVNYTLHQAARHDLAFAGKTLLFVRKLYIYRYSKYLATNIFMYNKYINYSNTDLIVIPLLMCCSFTHRTTNKNLYGSVFTFFLIILFAVPRVGKQLRLLLICTSDNCKYVLLLTLWQTVS